MTGSVIDGEDVVQDTAIKALEGFDRAGPPERPVQWLFRVAHNAAIDHLRRRSRHPIELLGEDAEAIADPDAVIENREAAEASLYAFVRLPPTQRSAVILSDVLDHTAEETAAITQTTVAAVKASLHRGRERLRQISAVEASPAMPKERQQVAAYAALFNARDFDAIRALLAEEVRLDLVNRLKLRGRGEIANYFTRYDAVNDWHFAPGTVEGHPALLVYDPAMPQPTKPKSFVLLAWQEGRIVSIKDFLFAPYVLDGADYETH